MTTGPHLNPDTDLPITLQRRLDTPGWWLSSPVVDGLTIHAVDTVELAAGIAALWRARNRDWYQDEDGREIAPRPPGRSTNTSWNVSLWQPLPDGWWLSPIGKRYRPGGKTVRLVEAKRRAQGLPVRYGETFTHQPPDQPEGWHQDWMPL